MFEAPRQFKSVALANADTAAAPQPADLDLGKICSTLWQGRTTILSAAAVALFAAVLFVLLAPHRFTAVTEILIEPSDLRALPNEAKPPNPASDTALLQVDSQVRVLTSDAVLRRVVDHEGLAQDPEFSRGPSLLRGALDKFSAALRRREALTRPDASLAALTELRRRVQVKRAERTYVVDIAVNSEEPAKAAQLANAVAQAYLDEQTQVRVDASRQVSRSLTARLNELKQSVQTAEERVQAFKVSHNIVGANGQLTNEQQLADLNNQLATARGRTAAAKARLDQIEALQRSKTEIGAFPEAVQSQTITALRSQYAEVMRREAEQTTSLGERHPAVIEIKAQAERLKHMIADEVNRIALAARADYETAKANEDLLGRNVDALKQSTLDTNAAMVTVRELERDVQASRAVYEAFLVRARETGEQEQLDTKNIHVISKADLPLGRSWPPSSSLIALAALFLGVAAGGGLVLIRNAGPEEPVRTSRDAAPPRRWRMPWRDRIPARRDRKAAPAIADNEVAPGVPVLAVMPQLDRIDHATLEDPRSQIAAGIHKVYDTVRAGPGKRDNPSVLVLASGVDSGTAPVALTLAALAAATQRVLLIDTDLERRTLSVIDADHGETGLVDVALGRRLLSEAVIRDGDTNVNFIPFVAPNSRRDRRITDEDVKLAFAQTSNFDMVIVAAADPSADPSTSFFAGLVDHVVLVVKTDEANKRAGAIVAALGLNARKVRGAVLAGA